MDVSQVGMLTPPTTPMSVPLPHYLLMVNGTTPQLSKPDTQESRFFSSHFFFFFLSLMYLGYFFLINQLY